MTTRLVLDALSALSKAQRADASLPGWRWTGLMLATMIVLELPPRDSCTQHAVPSAFCFTSCHIVLWLQKHTIIICQPDDMK